MILFIGDKPSPRMKPGAKAFEGAACEKRLKNWIDTIFEPGVEVYVINSNDIDFLRVMINECAWSTGKIITLGSIASKRVHKLVPKKYYFELPHPSGRNRKINDKEFIAKKLDECKSYIKERS